MRKPRPKVPAAPAPVSRSRVELLVYAILLLATFAVYSGVTQFSFVNFDDPDYVTANPHVRGGLTLSGVRWALTSGEAANWFPITRLSHMLDVQLFGLDSGWHHLTNVTLHALAAMLLFAFLRRATGAVWRSAFVALVFSLHPLHVESVAWVSERKDVLSAVFWFLALWAYARYAGRPSRGRYALALGAFALGLMSKPMVVTLPLVLLLLDFWPLRRGVHLREKIPFFALAAAAALATYFVQQSGGAVRSLDTFPLASRIANALVSYAVYMVKTIWPAGLAVFYPYPSSLPAWQVALAVAALAAVSYFVWRTYRTRPYLTAGWLWFVVTLLPVIGLVQVGAQARADRYMYIPMVGLLIMLAWGAPEAFPNARVLAPVAVAVCVIFAAASWGQAQSWRNSETLFEHALRVTDRNYLAHHNLGVALTEIPGRLPDAVAHLQESLRLQPDSARAHTDLGNALAKIPGRLPDALAEYQAALKIAPGDPIPQNDLAVALAGVPGRVPEAVAALEAAVRAKPEDAELRNNLGSALSKMRRLPEAIGQFEAALHLRPDYAEAHNNLGSALAEMPGRLTDAVAEYQAALRLKPDYGEAHINLGAALAALGRLPEAIPQYEAALRLQPDSVEAHNNLAGVLAAFPNRVPEAIAHYQAALKLDPNSADVHYNLGAALSRIEGREQEAIAHLEDAIRLKPDYPEAQNNLGVVLSNIPGRSREAIAHFEAALRLRPGYEDARYNLSLARRAVR